MQGRVIVITGPASGMGLATARLLASRGAILSLADLNRSGLDAALFTVEGSKHITIVVDVRNSSEVEACISKTVRERGKLDGACNMAGVHVGKDLPLAEESDEHWKSIMEINGKGVFCCMGAELKNMSEGGVIVNAASVAGIRGIPNSSIYVASKHAVIGLTRSAARENRARNTSINAIAPSTIHTPMVHKIEECLGGRVRTSQHP